MSDPNRSWYGHPVLNAGYNADDHDGDEVNGAGTNWSIWPVLLDSFVGLKPLIVSEEMLDIFDTTCPDYVVPGEHNTVTWPVDAWQVLARDNWREFVLPAESNVMVIPYQKPDITIRPELDTAVLAEDEQTHVVRRKA